MTTHNQLDEEHARRAAEEDFAKHIPQDPVVAYYVGRNEGARYERDSAVEAIIERYSENHPAVANSIAGMLFGGKHHE